MDDVTQNVINAIAEFWRVSPASLSPDTRVNLDLGIDGDEPLCRGVSPAIDAGDNAACPATDQRGFSRPAGAACDIGAYQVQ